MLEFLIETAAVVVVLFTLFYLINNRVKEMVELRRTKQSLDEDEQRVEVLERKNAAELAEATANERKEHERSKLLQETAEARVAAEIADNPEVIAARTEEEKRVIEARTEGRAQAAKERAASEGDGPDITALLVEAYKAFLSNGGSWTRNVTFERWLGDLDIDDFR